MFKHLNRKRTCPGFTLVELLVVVGVIGVLSAIAIPQYARYRRGAQDASAKEAAHSVAVAEEAFFMFQSKYTPSYSSLVADGGLIIDYNVLYGPIIVTIITDPPSYSFTINHRSVNSKTFTYASEGAATLLESGSRVITNDPTVP
ncbi:MAG: prepilin-type N-terminal cleavage/methylation domain-containing protein [Deltaproteobacteria bacterium]|jgi:prepilin-type N-terminal cleavage/methylation domain-containing protein|nr:prepilin-type N-terminal cleavage/methylation domain-containing protein [Deltaproteobacteria bacterium]